MFVFQSVGGGGRGGCVCRDRIVGGVTNCDDGGVTDCDDYRRFVLHNQLSVHVVVDASRGSLRTEYFNVQQDRNTVLAPIEHCEVRDSVDIIIRVHGGGTTGQAGACMQGIARALLKHDSDLTEKLREKHFLTRDSRMKERKKPGLHGARRGTQFSKR